MASTARATPARIRPVTGPPGWAATPAPLSPTKKAPEAATRWSGTGSDVATGLAVVVVAAAEACGPKVVTDSDDDVVDDGPGTEEPVSDEAETGEIDGADVAGAPDVFASVRCEPDEQPAPARATIRNRTRSFTTAHDRGPAQTPLSTSAISSPIWDGLRATRQPAFSRASILAAAVPFEPETMAPAWPIFFPGGAVTPAT